MYSRLETKEDGCSSPDKRISYGGADGKSQKSLEEGRILDEETATATAYEAATATAASENRVPTTSDQGATTKAASNDLADASDGGEVFEADPEVVGEDDGSSQDDLSVQGLTGLAEGSLKL